jgi:hypothetical protein
VPAVVLACSLNQRRLRGGAAVRDRRPFVHQARDTQQPPVRRMREHCGASIPAGVVSGRPERFASRCYSDCSPPPTRSWLPERNSTPHPTPSIVCLFPALTRIAIPPAYLDTSGS